MKTLSMLIAGVLIAVGISCAEKPASQPDKPSTPSTPKSESVSPKTDPAAQPAPIVTPAQPAQPAQPVKPVEHPLPPVTPPAGKAGVLDVPVADAAPKIDGVLDDAAWAKAATATLRTSEGKVPAVKSRVLVMQDKDHLYVAVECEEKGGAAKIAADTKQHDTSGIWQDDGVELFIDPTNQRKSYYQIIANTAGATWDAYHAESNSPDMSWEPKFTTAAKVGKESWVIEFALPLSMFNHTATSGAAWAFNVQRDGPDVSNEVYFSPLPGSSHDPERFGTLSGIKTVWKDRAVGAK